MTEPRTTDLSRTASSPSSLAAGSSTVGRGFRPVGGFRPGLGLTVVVMLVTAVLLGLGTWQMQRRAWKLDLIARAQVGLGLEPTPMPAAAEDWRAFDYRPMLASGRFITGEALLVGTSARAGELGGKLVIPLLMGDARVVLVDLGWLADSDFTAEKLRNMVPLGSVSVAGVALYRGEARSSFFTPAPRPEQGRWYGWDIPAMGAALGADLVPMVIVSEGQEVTEKGPRAAPVTVDFSNDHLGYALTWYGLALGLVTIYVLYGRARGIEVGQPRQRTPSARGGAPEAGLEQAKADGPSASLE